MNRRTWSLVMRFTGRRGRSISGIRRFLGFYFDDAETASLGMEDEEGENPKKDARTWKVEPNQLGRKDAGMHSCYLSHSRASDCMYVRVRINSGQPIGRLIKHRGNRCEREMR